MPSGPLLLGMLPLLIVSAVALVILSLTARAEEFPHSPNDLGPTGLMNMPTARMAEDGEFNTGVSYVSPFRRYFLSWQIFPAAQLTFRYTDKRSENGQPPTSSVPTNKDFFAGIFGSNETDVYLDRGFDLKLRLYSSGPWDQGHSANAETLPPLRLKTI